MIQGWALIKSNWKWGAGCLHDGRGRVKGITKFWYGVTNLVQMNILEEYVILQYSVIFAAVEIESKVMKL